MEIFGDARPFSLWYNGSTEARCIYKLLFILKIIRSTLRPAYGPILREEDGEVRRIVKAADKLSAYIKCLEEVEAGNNEFGDAAGETLEALRGMDMEEVPSAWASTATMWLCSWMFSVTLLRMRDHRVMYFILEM